ncbi:hypothetical protein [Nocardia macrotermitis]|uniref:WXG100 family type VII secretion target n=1 Tax=Nocardia macrotermitis TaxID=2585198 RepID=A0A7K0D454_9NOCA|nr:hypothetical protein [Nocardia macrotermitis]MQY20510.1 hypothetical protein [Nocardia macrotermitis]
MGNKTIKGYPIPADQNPDNLPAELVFPWGPASTLVTTAEKLNVPGVRDMVDTCHGMLGNPNQVPIIVGAWRTSIQELTSAVDGSDHSAGLSTAKENLNARWGGSAAAGAATDYVTRVISSTTDTRNIMKSMADEIDGFRSQIMSNYKQAIDHITKYANIILGLGASFLEEVEGALEFDFDLKGNTEAITKALQGFLDETNKVVGDLITYRDTMMTNLNKIRNSAATIQVPSEIAPAALDNGSWQPRKPTG